ncbi:UDP-glycosyltransferase 89B2-like [Apium graveolens]|uniref:UDP-glycosyltransferase 89B2-like n=1 Tax=Apium graveolens TaxID=4045 RepID=UPI003D795800
MESAGEILVLPFYGQGHLFPAMELCTHLASRNYNPTLIIPSYLSSSVPESLRSHPLIFVVDIPADPSDLQPPPPKVPASSGRGGGRNLFESQHQQLGIGIETYLTTRCKEEGYVSPKCVVVDVMMSWSKEMFHDFGLQTACFFTSGACAEAMDYASWKEGASEMKPSDTKILSGLPQDMALAYSDLDRKPRMGGRGLGRGHGGGGSHGPPGGDRMKHGPPGPGQKPKWLDEIEGSVAMLINTCDELEHDFIKYIATQTGKPVWGVGPLLPQEYWKSAGSLILDGKVRSGGRKSNYTEEEVIQWLNGKPGKSVIYISFGSEVGPTNEEYQKLATALEGSDWSFIWVIQANSGKTGPLLGIQNDQEGGFYPYGLKQKVGDRGLIIQGWAPQLLILSHPSTGGFLSHCGWNSTVEAIGCGVPFLAWPIRGDQFHNAKLIVSHLKVGCKVSSGGSSHPLKQEDIANGINTLMSDEEIHKRAAVIQGCFASGFPASSVSALDVFVDFISKMQLS